MVKTLKSRYRCVPKIASPEARKFSKVTSKRKHVRTTRVLVAGGVCILLCCPVSKRLQKRRPKNLGFGKKRIVGRNDDEVQCHFRGGAETGQDLTVGLKSSSTILRMGRPCHSGRAVLSEGVIVGTSFQRPAVARHGRRHEQRSPDSWASLQSLAMGDNDTVIFMCENGGLLLARKSGYVDKGRVEQQHQGFHLLEEASSAVNSPIRPIQELRSTQSSSWQQAGNNF